MPGGKTAHLKIAVVQMTSTDNLESNIQQIWTLLKEVAEVPGVQLISFPENCFFLRVSLKDKLDILSLNDPRILQINQWALDHKFQIHIGAMAYREEGRVYNATVWLGRSSTPEVVYKKIHLFDVKIGEQNLMESADFAAGSEPAVIDVFGWKVALSICYDLRFSELYLAYAKQHVDLILIPAAFLDITGEAHWHSLLRARAIESQSYIVAAAQCGEHVSVSSGKSRKTFGHSLAVDPWGIVISDNSSVGPSYKVVELNKELIADVRAKIPMDKHRKL